MQPPPGFTTTLPENYDTSPDWYFVWHSPDPTATTSGHAWDANGKYFTRTWPDDSRRRGTGLPVPASKLGYYARLNSEGQHWSWMLMPAFVQLMEGGRGGDAGVQRLREVAEAALKHIEREATEFSAASRYSQVTVEELRAKLVEAPN